MEEFKYLGITLTHQILFRKKFRPYCSQGMFAIIRCRTFCLPSLLPNNYEIKIHRTIILPVFYGCETWSLTLKDKCQLRVFENRVLRRIFGPKRDEVRQE
jgi:hypothetical protein